ncbi:MAG TPA: sulfatase [Sumerlaeia bacterium]|nr:sulfatase [Sumerlaeia bacterium]
MKPNIVLFLVDDMGWQDTSVPFHAERTPFNDRFRTPNMERLARQGVKFTNAYACPLCSPTRTSIMTGLNAARHRVTQWTLRPGVDPSQKAEDMESPPWQVNGLQPGIPTLPGILREDGYRTIHVGKAHFGAKGTEGEDPRRLGFDVNIAGHAAGGPGSYHGTNNFSAAWRNGDRIWDVPGLEQYHGQDINLSEALTIEANKALAEAAGTGKPFYLYMSHYTVHTPLEPDKRFVQRYLDQGVDKAEAVYASMVESMDDSLGQILKKLEDLGVAEDTIILFASDNGGLSHGPRGKTPMGTGHYTHNWPLSAGKCSAYEGGVRVPMLVSWAKPAPANPRQKRIPIQPGSICHEPVICDDFLPTLCRWAGVEDLEKRVERLDGQDITGAVAGDASFRRPGELVFHYPHFINYGKGTIEHGYGPFSALRDGNWKIIYFYDRRKWELYDLSRDIGEKNDLALEEPDLLGRLAGKLVERLRDMDAQYPVVSATGEQVSIGLP